MSVLKRKGARPAAVCQMIVELEAGSCTVPYLVEASGLSVPTVIGWLRAMHDAKLVHITEWSNERNTTAHYTWGYGADAKRPPVMTAAQRMAKSRAAKKGGAK